MLKNYIYSHVECTASPVCGLAMLNPGWRHMERNLENESVLIFGRKNSALIDIGDETVEIKPGRAVLLPAGVFHRGSETIREPVSYWWVHFFQQFEDKNKTRYFLPVEYEKKKQPDFMVKNNKNSVVLPLYLDVQNSALYANLLTEILHEYEEPGFSPLMYNALVEKFILTIAEEYYLSEKQVEFVSQKEKSSPLLVKKLLELIEEELSNPNASVKFFAAEMSLNADYIGRCFKEVKGVSVGQYIQRRRVELACSRLRENSASVEEIAFMCGFGSRRQFYDEFKKFTKKTPSQYRADSAYVGLNVL